MNVVGFYIYCVVELVVTSFYSCSELYIVSNKGAAQDIVIRVSYQVVFVRVDQCSADVPRKRYFSGLLRTRFVSSKDRYLGRPPNLVTLSTQLHTLNVKDVMWFI